MKKNNPNSFDYTEKEMGNAFLDYFKLNDKIPNIGFVKRIYPEISCQQGRPDFISINYKNLTFSPELFKNIGLVGASILSILKPKSPRSYQYLNQKLSYSKSSIVKYLRLLIATGFIKKTSQNSFILSKIIENLEIEIYAFELKINNPKRAIFQAQQFRFFAGRSFIIVPPNQTRNYERFKPTIKRWGIGLYSFDPLESKLTVSIRSRKGKPLSKQQQFYTLSRVYNS